MIWIKLSWLIIQKKKKKTFLRGGFCLEGNVFWRLFSFILSTVTTELWNTGALWQNEGKERCGRRGEGGKIKKVGVALPLPGRWNAPLICRKHLPPPSSPPIMDTKTKISFKERPDVVTLYLIVDFNLKEQRLSVYYDECFVQICWRGGGFSESAVCRWGEFCVE